jgi:hypothetical protein
MWVCNTFHYLSTQPSQPGCLSESSNISNPNANDNDSPQAITVAERAALNEVMRKVVSCLLFHELVLTKFSKQILPDLKIPVLFPEQ